MAGNCVHGMRTAYKYLTECVMKRPPSRRPYSDVVWSCDPESYAGGSVAIRKVSHAGQVKGDDPDKKGTLVLQFGGCAWGGQLHLVRSLTC
jgi:hypothetical protein